MSKSKGLAHNTPHYAIAATVFLIGVGVIAATLTNNDASLSLLIGLIVTTVPSLIAAGFAERASRDIRNGTVTEKAREGAEQALNDTGVVQAVEEGKQTTPAALTALIMLLQERLEMDAEDKEHLAEHRAEQKRGRP